MFQDWADDADSLSFQDSDRFEEDSLCSWISERESLCNNWRGWKKPNSSSVAHSQRNRGGVVTPLVELAARVVATHVPFEVVEHVYPPVPEQLQLRIAYWSFPESEEDIRLYSCLANGNADEFQRGEHMFRSRCVKDVLQIGFHLSATLRTPQSVSPIKTQQKVAVTFDRCRITSCNCTCNSPASWCSHVVAVCLHRIHQANSICLRAPVSESLSRLHRDQLQKFAQYLISELPQQILPTAQRLLDELLSGQDSAINTLRGAPDPTAGASVTEQTTWCLDEMTLHKSIRKILVKLCVPSPIVFSDVNYLTCSAPPAASEWSSLLRPLRGREPEGMWNLLSIVREMFRRCDRNAIPLLELLTEEVLACDQILVWWFNTKVALHTGGTANAIPNAHRAAAAAGGNGGGGSAGANNGGGGNALHAVNTHGSQHACSSLCDELVCLWRLAALNPGLSPAEREHFFKQLCAWHVKVLDRIVKVRTSTGAGASTASNNHHHHHHHNHQQHGGGSGGSYASIRATSDLEIFPGFKPALEACLLDWNDYQIEGVTYMEGAACRWYSPYMPPMRLGTSNEEHGSGSSLCGGGGTTVLSSHDATSSTITAGTSGSNSCSGSATISVPSTTGTPSTSGVALCGSRTRCRAVEIGSRDPQQQSHGCTSISHGVSSSCSCLPSSSRISLGAATQDNVNAASVSSSAGGVYAAGPSNRSSLSSEGFCEPEFNSRGDNGNGGDSVQGECGARRSSDEMSASEFSSSDDQPQGGAVGGDHDVSARKALSSSWAKTNQSKADSKSFEDSDEWNARPNERRRSLNAPLETMNALYDALSEGAAAAGLPQAVVEGSGSCAVPPGNGSNEDIANNNSASGIAATAAAAASASSLVSAARPDCSGDDTVSKREVEDQLKLYYYVTDPDTRLREAGDARAPSVNPRQQPLPLLPLQQQHHQLVQQQQQQQPQQQQHVPQPPAASTSSTTGHSGCGYDTSILNVDALARQIKKIDDKLEILFARAEALHSHGHTKAACTLAVQLADELLASPPSFDVSENNGNATLAQSGIPQQTVPPTKSSSGSKRPIRKFNPASHQASLLASATLAKAAFLCQVLGEHYATHHYLAFKIGLFGLEMMRPPASTKPLEVKLANQEQDLVILLKRIPLCERMMRDIREKAKALRDRQLVSRGDALLPLTLASYMFDALVLSVYSMGSVANASGAGNNAGGTTAASAGAGGGSTSTSAPPIECYHKLPTDEMLGFEAAVAALGLKANVSEAEHPLLCEGTRRQRGDLAITLLVHYKDDRDKLAKIMDKLLDKEVHQMYKMPPCSSYYSADLPVSGESGAVGLSASAAVGGGSAASGGGGATGGATSAADEQDRHSASPHDSSSGWEENYKAWEAKFRCTNLRTHHPKRSNPLASVDSSAPETTSSDNSPTLVRRRVVARSVAAQANGAAGPSNSVSANGGVPSGGVQAPESDLGSSRDSSDSFGSSRNVCSSSGVGEKQSPPLHHLHHHHHLHYSLSASASVGNMATAAAVAGGGASNMAPSASSLATTTGSVVMTPVTMSASSPALSSAATTMLPIQSHRQIATTPGSCSSPGVSSFAPMQQQQQQQRHQQQPNMAPGISTQSNGMYYGRDMGGGGAAGGDAAQMGGGQQTAAPLFSHHNGFYPSAGDALMNQRLVNTSNVRSGNNGSMTMLHRYKSSKRPYHPSVPNQPSEASAHFMFELAKTVLTKAGGNSTTAVLFTQPSASAQHQGPHRALHMCAFQIGLYALGLHNAVSPNWLSRTYSSHVSWITGQAIEIGTPAIRFLIDTWEGHLTPPEVASLADSASRGRDRGIVRVAAELALSCLPHAHALNPNEIQRALLQCKEQSSAMLERACLAVEGAAKGGGVYPEVLFDVARRWFSLYEESLGTNATPGDHNSVSNSLSGQLMPSAQLPPQQQQSQTAALAAPPTGSFIVTDAPPYSPVTSALVTLYHQPHHVTGPYFYHYNHHHHPAAAAGVPPQYIPLPLPPAIVNGQISVPPPPIQFATQDGPPGAPPPMYHHHNTYVQQQPTGGMVPQRHQMHHVRPLVPPGALSQQMAPPGMSLGQPPPSHQAIPGSQQPSGQLMPGGSMVQQQPGGGGGSGVSSQQSGYLMSAYRVGLLAMDTLARRVHDDRPQAKYARNPPYGEDVKWLLGIAKQLGTAQVQEFCMCTVNSVASPYVLFDILNETWGIIRGTGGSQVLATLIQKCQQMFIECTQAKMRHITATEYDDLISTLHATQKACALTPAGVLQFTELVPWLLRSKTCKKDLREIIERSVYHRPA